MNALRLTIVEKETSQKWYIRLKGWAKTYHGPNQGQIRYVQKKPTRDGGLRTCNPQPYPDTGQPSALPWRVRVSPFPPLVHTHPSIITS